MKVYVVVGTIPTTQAKLKARINAQFVDNCIEISGSTWLVAGQGTAKQISDKLEITPEGNGGFGVVFRVDSYYGRADPAIWDWIQDKLEKKTNGD